MKTAVSLPDPLFEAADDLARVLGVSRSELYARALRTFLAAHDRAAKRQALDELYAEESSALPSGAAEAQRRVVADDE
jgi:metal-responsive CopG/Arc/MetJ family transcriptional regulator